MPPLPLKQAEHVLAIIAMDELDTWRRRLEAERQRMLQGSDIDPTPVREVILPNQYISWASPTGKRGPTGTLPDGIHWGLICDPALYYFHWTTSNSPVSEEDKTIIVDGVRCSKNDCYAILNDLPLGNYIGETSLTGESVLETGIHESIIETTADVVANFLISLYGCHHIVFKNIRSLISTWVSLILDPPFPSNDLKYLANDKALVPFHNSVLT